MAVSLRRPWLRTLGEDPRFYQSSVLAGLVGYGVLWLDFAVSVPQLVTILGTALLTQAVGQWVWHMSPYDPRSALISALSLCLLLRTNALRLTVLATILSLGSKFVLRWRHKHLFNPTNFGLVATMLLSDQVWVSPGQWGSGVTLAFLLACCGGMVVYRASRSDVTLAFLAILIGLRWGRAWWLGDPWSIPLHQVQNGALVLFAFFMISDPRTTPDSRLGRLVFAGLVALGGWYGQLTWYRSDALLWSLAVCTLTVPLLNWLWPGPPYAWPGR
ncbi:MAG: hypothetical protein FJZ47_16440 [Candidatus Tectomicrobia bacterium]|uniref:Na+-transporting NADH:ubiquinone oxidoreductase, subunit NqrB n=1 Tax=Tectimicrobiota bacterium TaxID=2528274 RepID=A0A938B3T0_UNCTE|nr:hypothetical protein [Candidatus Tectomicrobia bacterium]